MPDRQHAACYPTQAQYERWKEHANDLDMGVSEYMQAMIEAGRKKFELEPRRDEMPQELREQRNELKRELQKARNRINELEQAVYSGEREAIARYVEENPGATVDDITQHILDTTVPRVSKALDVLQGSKIENRDGEYYPVGGPD